MLRKWIRKWLGLTQLEEYMRHWSVGAQECLDDQAGNQGITNARLRTIEKILLENGLIKTEQDAQHAKDL